MPSVLLRKHQTKTNDSIIDLFRLWTSIWILNRTMLCHRCCFLSKNDRLERNIEQSIVSSLETFKHGWRIFACLLFSLFRVFDLCLSSDRVVAMFWYFLLVEWCTFFYPTLLLLNLCHSFKINPVRGFWKILSAHLVFRFISVRLYICLDGYF